MVTPGKRVYITLAGLTELVTDVDTLDEATTGPTPDELATATEMAEAGTGWVTKNGCVYQPAELRAYLAAFYSPIINGESTRVTADHFLLLDEGRPVELAPLHVRHF